MPETEFSLMCEPSSRSFLRGPLGAPKPGVALTSSLGVQVLPVFQ